MPRETQRIRRSERFERELNVQWTYPNGCVASYVYRWGHIDNVWAFDPTGTPLMPEPVEVFDHLEAYRVILAAFAGWVQ